MEDGGITGQTELATFVAELATDEDKFRAYEQDAEAAMEAAGLTEAEKKTIRSGSWDEILTAFGWPISAPMVQHSSG